MVNEVQGCGRCSGRDGIDKFARFNLTPLPSKYVKPPIIAECPVNLECRVVAFHHVGDHDLFIGEVLLEHVDEVKVNSNGERDESSTPSITPIPEPTLNNLVEYTEELRLRFPSRFCVTIWR
jgi:flavin reductase (DIM6/NTAB) family NADH-FMN oxidoreductase RutF